MLKLGMLAILFLLFSCDEEEKDKEVPADYKVDASLNKAKTEDYDYLNEIRKEAGLITYKKNEVLEQSALNHAYYLSINDLRGHVGSSDKEGFTGESAGDRAEFAGYQAYKTVGEVVSYRDTAKKSIDSLMSAIYHRNNLLNLNRDEIGIGYLEPKDEDSNGRFVANNGNGKVAELCAKGENYSGKGKYYKVCDPEIKVGEEPYLAAKNANLDTNPEMVIWPPDGAEGIQPVFYEETPDPLPDYGVSGYPVSMVFNSKKVEKVEVKSLEIYTKEDGAKIEDVRFLNESSDPSKKFTSHQFVLFPLARLKYNTAYLVKASWIQDDEEKSKEWSFTTKDLGGETFEIEEKTSSFEVKSGETYYLYNPPYKDPPTGSRKYQPDKGVTFERESVDSSTLQVKVSGDAGGKVTVTYPDGKVVTLVIKA